MAHKAAKDLQATGALLLRSSAKLKEAARGPCATVGIAQGPLKVIERLWVTASDGVLCLLPAASRMPSSTRRSGRLARSSQATGIIALRGHCCRLRRLPTRCLTPAPPSTGPLPTPKRRRTQCNARQQGGAR